MYHVLLTMIWGIFTSYFRDSFLQYLKKTIIYIFPFFLFVGREGQCYLFQFCYVDALAYSDKDISHIWL
jgi:hypothetical protein